MIILITGVSSGFGKAMALRLAKDGHKVYGTVRREVDPLEGVTYLTTDVRDDAGIAAAFAQLMKAEGRLDVFINNAGMGIGGPLEFNPVEDVQMQMDVNFMGMVKWLSHVVPVMRRQGEGKILCVSSIGGLMGLPYQ
jgi:NAD(P)-dependent dehydrogenase (short-subunit alcohol dehydrogenase family)